MAESMSEEQLKDFAKTKRIRLPQKKKNYQAHRAILAAL
jgi:Protein of unknwon function (DUF3008)